MLRVGMSRLRTVAGVGMRMGYIFIAVEMDMGKKRRARVIKHEQQQQQYTPQFPQSLTFLYLMPAATTSKARAKVIIKTGIADNPEVVP